MNNSKTMMTRMSRILTIFAFCLLSLWQPATAATDIKVEAVVESQEAYVGEPLTLQIRIDGAEPGDEPDLSGLTDFIVEPRGGQSTSSTTMTIINGKWQHQTHHGYVFSFTITPKREGRLSIPPIPLEIDGRTFKSNPLAIMARAPEETDDFKLRVFLAKDSCYTGEPVLMTTTWFVADDVKNFNFTMPLLEDPRFEVVPVTDQPPGRESLKIPVGGERVVAEKGKGQLGDREYVTLTFQHLLIPKEPGTFTLPQATVACQIFSGYRQSGRQRPFGSFGGRDLFDNFFGRGRDPLYRTLVVPANEPELTVLPLPEKGRPATFSGLVGDYRLNATAKPTEVNVGDPITLTVTLTGPYVARAELPALERFLSPSSFKIPEEIAPGETGPGRKIFTQTIRATNERVSEIPPLELVYFDTASGRYQSTTTEPIPLDVHATRVVTADDAVGADARPHRKIQAAREGLAHNYEGEDVLVSRSETSPWPAHWWILLLALPPLLFLATALASGLIRRHGHDPARKRSQRALAELRRALAVPDLSPDTLSLAARNYLAAKLDKKAGALTFGDVAPLLEARGVAREVLAELGRLMEQCESLRYAGGAFAGLDSGEMKERLLRLAQQVDSHF